MELAYTWTFLGETVLPAVARQHLEIACWQISQTASFCCTRLLSSRPSRRREFKFQTMLSLQLNSYYGDYVVTRKQHVRSLNQRASRIAGQCQRSEPSACPASNMSTITGRSAIIFGRLGVPAGRNLFFINVTISLRGICLTLVTTFELYLL